MQQNLKSWLKKIESLNGSEKNINLGLESVKFFADKLKLQKPAYQVITVAGTNGKGTTVKLLEALYTKAGYKVASFTSPHILRFNERVSINNSNISDEQLIEAFKKVYKVSSELSSEYNLSYFEFVFLSAWYIFQNFYKLDLLILEVGLGGRLDAVNIIENDISVITSIDYDHQAYLGETLEEIAFEKAGIIKPSSNTIIGRNIPRIVQEKAKEFSCKYKVLGYNYDVLSKSKSYSGIHQDNIAICYEVALTNNEENNLFIEKNFLDNFFDNLSENFKMPGRAELQETSNNNILFDVAHNQHSITNLYNKIRYLKNNNNYKRIYAICGMLKDKHSAGILKNIDDIVDSWGVIDLSKISPRGMTSFELSESISGRNSKEFLTAEEAFEYFDNIITKQDLLVVFGSFHTVSQLYDKNF